METVLSRSGPRYGRPSERFGPPTALFDSALAVLLYDLEHLEAFTPLSTTMPYAFELISRSTGFFDGGDVRGLNLRNVLTALLPGEIKWQHSMADGAVKPYGAWFEGSFVYMIFQLKNEPGLEGDPFLHGLAAYTKIIKQEKVSSPRPLVCDPIAKLP